MNASFCCIVLCTDRFALKLSELWGRNWQMFIFMLEKECLAGINKPTYFRQRNAIVASLFHHYQSDCCMHHLNVGWISGISALDHQKKKRLRCTQLTFFLSQALKSVFDQHSWNLADCSQLLLGLGQHYHMSIPAQHWLKCWAAVGKWSIFI